MERHDAAWLAGVEAHVREARAGEALRRHGPGGGRARAAAAAAARETWLREKVVASVFARVLQDIERGPLPELRAAGAARRGLAGAIVRGSRTGCW